MKIPLAIVEDNQVADLSVALENEGVNLPISSLAGGVCTCWCGGTR